LNLQQANHVLETALEQGIRSASGLSLAEYEALFRLKLASDHPLQMSEIASVLMNSPSGMTRIADRLVKGGLIERDTPMDNRRVVRVKLTAKGSRLLDRADQAFREALEGSFSSHLTDNEIADLRRLMRKLLESNGAWQQNRCAPPL